MRSRDLRVAAVLRATFLRGGLARSPSRGDTVARGEAMRAIVLVMYLWCAARDAWWSTT